jgi:acylphosphatase
MIMQGSRKWYEEIGKKFGVQTHVHSAMPGAVTIAVIGDQENREKAIGYIREHAPLGVKLTFI